MATSELRRPSAVVLTAMTLVAAFAGCMGAKRASGRQAYAEEAAAPARLALDPVASSVPFRWLADDAVLVDAKVTTRKLAGFGNYVSRAALKFSRAKLSVWDDESAWKVAQEGGDDQKEVLAHKRAEYVKDLSPPDPVDRYLVFARDGTVEYQRDFRSWPLTDTDAID